MLRFASLGPLPSLMARACCGLMFAPGAIADAEVVSTGHNRTAASPLPHLLDKLANFSEGMEALKEVQVMHDEILQLLSARKLHFQFRIQEQADTIKNVDAGNAKLTDDIELLKTQIATYRQQIRNLTLEHQALQVRASELSEEFQPSKMPSGRAGLRLLSIVHGRTTAGVSTGDEDAHVSTEPTLSRSFYSLSNADATQLKEQAQFLSGISTAIVEMQELEAMFAQKEETHQRRVHILTQESRDLHMLRKSMLKMKASLGEALKALQSQHQSLQEDVRTLEEATRVKHTANKHLLLRGASIGDTSKLPVFR